MTAPETQNGTPPMSPLHSALLGFLQDNKKMATAIVSAFFCFPFITTIYVVGQSSGYFLSTEQAAHLDMKIDHQEMQANQDNFVRILNSLKSSSEDIAYFLQQDCVRKAENNSQKDDCTKPKWMRQTVQDR